MSWWLPVSKTIILSIEFAQTMLLESSINTKLKVNISSRRIVKSWTRNSYLGPGNVIASSDVKKQLVSITYTEDYALQSIITSLGCVNGKYNPSMHSNHQTRKTMFVFYRKPKQYAPNVSYVLNMFINNEIHQERTINN